MYFDETLTANHTLQPLSADAGTSASLSASQSRSGAFGISVPLAVVRQSSIDISNTISVCARKLSPAAGTGFFSGSVT
jgi:hypothetical protein